MAKAVVKPTVQKTDQHEEFVSHIDQSIKRTRDLKLVHGIEEFDKAKTVTQIVDLIISKARESSVSDIHVDPQPDSVIVRYRIDGIMHDVISVEKNLQPLIITRIKVLAGLRTDEHYIAQDGRFRVNFGEIEVDLRISIVPTYNGENIVMRLLKSGARVLTLEELGFTKRDLEIMQRYIDKPNGMILSTGPTGSGKTTSLYSILQILNSRDISIVTIEDPIEYSVPGITQIQVNIQTNLTFAAGLRSIVRQDPNIILVGEIRDRETAGIAVNAAMTGHLLLSTLHTTDAATTLPRLLDMGIEPFLIASTVNVAIGQRLVRKLCDHCREEYKLTNEESIALAKAIPPELLKKQKDFWKPKGCDKCNDTGYTQRVGIFELLEITEEIRKLVMRRANADEIRQVAQQQGMTTMMEDGLLKVSKGITSLAEIMRVVHD